VALVGEQAPSGVAISDDDRLEAVSSFCDKGGIVSIGHTRSGKKLKTFYQHERLSRIAFNPAGTQLALASWDSSVTVVNVATNQRALELLGHTRFVTDLAYSSVGHLIATTSFDNTLRIWNASNGQLLQVDHDGSFTSVPSFSPYGQYVTDVDLDYNLHVWQSCLDCQDPSALLAASQLYVVPQNRLTTVELAAVKAAGGRLG
jgi:WD40 repeat protein